MDSLITSGVIISKLGYGVNSIRRTVETVYVALVRVVDELPHAARQPAKLRTLAMTLRVEKVLDGSSNVDHKAIEIDARVGAEVTEIIRRSLAEEFS